MSTPPDEEPGRLWSDLFHECAEWIERGGKRSEEQEFVRGLSQRGGVSLASAAWVYATARSFVLDDPPQPPEPVDF